jgi:alkylated DNA nucleotide flippase Atl1
MFKIHSLFIKPAPNTSMQSVRTVEAVTGYGLLGDCNANTASPRQVLLVDQHSIRELALGYSDLRANLVIDGDLKNLQSGTILVFGESRLRITIPCEPCGKLNAVRPGLSRNIGSRRGLLARVLSGGTLQTGDNGSTEAVSAQPLALDWKTRVRDIVAQIPEGKVITYAALVTVAGVQSAYCRALPAILRSMGSDDIPVHRVVPADPRKIDPRHTRKLRSEGTDIEAGTAELWNNAMYFAEQE